MVKTKPIDVVVKKWVERASAATGDYEYGIRNPKEDWATACKNAFDAYVAGVQQAIAEKRYLVGVERAGTGTWQKAALEKGVRRYAEGIRASQARYKERMAKVLEILSAIELPPRGPRGDPKNIDRVRVIAEALHRAKVEGRI